MNIFRRRLRRDNDEPPKSEDTKPADSKPEKKQRAPNKWVAHILRLESAGQQRLFK